MQGEPSAKRAYGTGSIIERRGDYYGKWRAHGKQVWRLLGPKRRRGESDGLTRAQAEARLRELMAEHEASLRAKAAETPVLPNRTIAELGALYIEHARERRGLKATTLSDYESAVRIHLVPFFGDAPVESIDAPRIEAFALHLRAKEGQGRRGGKPLSPKSIENYLGILTVLLNFAVRKKWIGASPMHAVDLPKTPGDEPLPELTFLEPHEVERLIAKAQPGPYHDLDRALYTLAAYSGLRQGELRGLRWEHIDFDRSLIHVLENVTRGRRSSPKGKRRRTVPLAPTAAKALRDLHARTAWSALKHVVFATPSTGQPMARATLMKRYRQALIAAGLPAEFSFHDLRHTFGTTMARAGVPVGTIQAWMGHADLATTQLYMHYAPAEQDAARIDAAFAPGGINGAQGSGSTGAA